MMGPWQTCQSHTQTSLTYSEFYHICAFLQLDFIKIKTITKLQALENAASLASAYQIGKLESQACSNLLKNIAPPIVDGLKELVRLVNESLKKTILFML